MTLLLRNRELQALKFTSRIVEPPIRIVDDDFFNPNHWFEPLDEVFYISLSDRVDLYCQVDYEDFIWARQWKWCHTFGSGARKNGCQKLYDKLYARRAVSTPIGNRSIWLHRQICERYWGPPPSGAYVADHLDGNSLNNRRCNLRWATLSQNSRNIYGVAWLQYRMFDDAPPKPKRRRRRKR